MTKYIKLIKWIKQHRKRGIASFRVETDSNTFIITTEDCEQTRESWEKNMLRIPYK